MQTCDCTTGRHIMTTASLSTGRVRPSMALCMATRPATRPSRRTPAPTRTRRCRKVTGPILKAMRPHLPLRVLHELAQRSTDWWLMWEDLPWRDNRVVLDARGGIVVHRQLTNYAAHPQFVLFTRRLLPPAREPP